MTALRIRARGPAVTLKTRTVRFGLCSTTGGKACTDAGHVPVVVEELHQRGRDVRRTPDRRRRTETGRHPVAQAALRHAEVPLELDTRDAVYRLELVVHVDAACRVTDVDLNVLEAAETVKVRDGFAHVAHQEGLADTRLDEIHERRLGRALTFHVDRDVADCPADVLGGRRLLAAHGRRHEQTGRSTRSWSQSASEAAANPEIDGELPVAVLREHPADPVALVVFENDDLVADGRAERAREGEVRAIRQALADSQPRRRRQRIVRRAEARAELHRVDPEGLLDGAADRPDNRPVSNRARAARAAPPPTASRPQAAARRSSAFADVGRSGRTAAR